MNSLMRKFEVIALVTVLAFTGCGDSSTADPTGGPAGPPGPDNTKPAPAWIEIAVKTAKEEVELRMTGDDITIDWGDGAVDKAGTLTAGRFVHIYTSAAPYTIAVSGKIIDFECFSNEAESIELSANTVLQNLVCRDNKLTELDLSGCASLTWLNCHDNLLENLNISGCTKLKYLSCNNNRLTSLDLSACKALIKFDCSNNKLTSLGVSGYTALEQLNCSNNLLTNLSVSGCAKLEYFGCLANTLTSINVSGCTTLKDLDCRDNKMEASALNAVFGALPLRPITVNAKVWIENNPGTDGCNQSIAEAKNWEVIER